ncbi:GIY-YIG nuclease family protein [Desulfobaculum sp. SPO524]|uniref:GIY-YIG nuclease family protein n=1 Tax=Desulfobaculum sp. SPO524 TaxID=3378071 RepID=UPI003852EED1
MLLFREYIFQPEFADPPPYAFSVFSPESEFPKINGVYIFGELMDLPSRPNFIEPLYVGETEDFSRRWQEHLNSPKGKWPCAKQYGGNCVCLLEVDPNHDRLGIQNLFIEVLDPPCNERR